VIRTNFILTTPLHIPKSIVRYCFCWLKMPIIQVDNSICMWPTSNEVVCFSYKTAPYGNFVWQRRALHGTERRNTMTGLLEFICQRPWMRISSCLEGLIYGNIT
jgi:hypothetical protein